MDWLTGGYKLGLSSFFVILLFGNACSWPERTAPSEYSYSEHFNDEKKQAEFEAALEKWIDCFILKQESPQYDSEARNLDSLSNEYLKRPFDRVDAAFLSSGEVEHDAKINFLRKIGFQAAMDRIEHLLEKGDWSSNGTKLKNVIAPLEESSGCSLEDNFILGNDFIVEKGKRGIGLSGVKATALLILLLMLLIFLLRFLFLRSKQRKLEIVNRQTKDINMNFINTLVNSSAFYDVIAENIDRRFKDQFLKQKEELIAKMEGLESRIINLESKLMGLDGGDSTLGEFSGSEEVVVEAEGAAVKKNLFRSLYFEFPDKEGTFPMDRGILKPSHASFYRITFEDGEDQGSVEIFKNNARLDMVLDSPGIYLEPVCEIYYQVASLRDAKGVVMKAPGKVHLSDGKWYVDQKIQVEIR